MIQRSHANSCKMTMARMDHVAPKGTWPARHFCTLVLRFLEDFATIVTYKLDFTIRTKWKNQLTASGQAGSLEFSCTSRYVFFPPSYCKSTNMAWPRIRVKIIFLKLCFQIYFKLIQFAIFSGSIPAPYNGPTSGACTTTQWVEHKN